MTTYRGGGCHLQRGHGRSGARPAYLTLAVLALVWAGTASAADQPCTLRIEPTVAIITCPLAPAPPVTPPVVVVPPVDPPKPPVVRNPAPFVLPTDCPRVPWNGSGDRSYRLGEVPLPDFGGFYAAADGTGNPIGLAGTCACIIKPGAAIKGQGGQPDRSVGNLRLWVPKAAADKYGDEIRCACETGRLTCP